MRGSEKPGVTQHVIRAVASLVFVVALCSIGFGLWLWFGTGGDDIASILGALAIGGGCAVAFPSFAVARTGRFRGI